MEKLFTSTSKTLDFRTIEEMDPSVADGYNVIYDREVPFELRLQESNDGPQEVGMDDFARHSLGDVRYQRSSLEDAYNPPQPVIKYRVVYFKYLDK